MKRFLVAIFLLFVSVAARAEVSLGVGLPQGLELGYRQHFGDSPWSLKVSVGGWPIERAWPGNLVFHSDLDETYACDAAPRVYAVTSGIKALYSSSPTSRWTWSVGPEFWMIHGGAVVFLRNKGTEESVMISELNATWWQPVLSAGVSWTFSRGATSQWELGLDVAFLVGGSMRAEAQGPLPALQNVAPEFGDAMQDGTAAAEKNLTGAIRDAMEKFPIIPSLTIRYVW